ncbi:hypothetical protein [Streptomyces sp. NPDC002490]|uniref:hypothetical protein n=1 Tax=Streptomyces sp. NPDC002490 TaxID=3154416 RepID=UPI00332D0F5D
MPAPPPGSGGTPEAGGSDRLPGTEGPAEGPTPLGVDRFPTGHPPVDAHLTRLADADRLATEGHLAVYEDVHRGLRETLTALDQPTGPPAPAPPRGPAPSYDHRS